MAMTMFNHLFEKNKGNNFIFSPLSIDTILNMLASASKEEALQNFLSLLGYESTADLNAKSSELMTAVFGKIKSSTPMDEEGNVLSFVNGAWVDQQFKLVPSFQETIASIYKVHATEVEFYNKPKETVDEVNSWAEKYTKGKIKNILSNKVVEDPPALVLANALYFNGDWKVPFEKSDTKDAEFYLLNGESVEAPFLYQEYQCQYSYASYDDFKILRMPYKKDNEGTKFFMYILIPREKNGLLTLMKQVDSNPGFFNQNFVRLKKKTIDVVKIPKFKILNELVLAEILMERGLELNFQNTEMIIPKIDSDPYLLMNRRLEIIHKAYIDVNERGTEAAAVTVEYDDMGFGLGVEIPPPLKFIADHPFLFMIREDISGIPFFIGAVLNPLAEPSG
ncbi:Serpin-ZX-like [Quillaja saponaria]|uniref:Serpin-ZX-like n=1 Tax=Quillaja saponaria TaxID=32244 RepID=A0AAD7QJ45_QUISA|nr:Serpin-ZX-like [Quillaja saponaria]